MENKNNIYTPKHGNTGKKNAIKPETEKASVNIHFRCKELDNAKWREKASAEGMKLTQWIVKTLNNATTI